MQNPQKLVFRRGLVKVGSFLVHKESVRRPDKVDILGAHHQLLQIRLSVKPEPRIRPELTEVHVQSKILNIKIIIRILNYICDIYYNTYIEVNLECRILNKIWQFHISCLV